MNHTAGPSSRASALVRVVPPSTVPSHGADDPGQGSFVPGARAPQPVRVVVDELCDLARLGMSAVLSRYRRSVVVHHPDDAADLGGVDLVLYDGSVRRDVVDHDARPAARRVLCSWGPCAEPEEQSSWLDLSLPADEIVARLLVLRWRTASAGSGVDDVAAVGVAPGTALVGRAGLGPREAQVLALVGQGLSNAEIAELLNVTINTLKTYIRTGYRKIGVSTRTQAALWVVGVQ